MTKVADRLWTAEVPVALCTCTLLESALLLQVGGLHAWQVLSRRHDSITTMNLS